MKAHHLGSTIVGVLLIVVIVSGCGLSGSCPDKGDPLFAEMEIGEFLSFSAGSVGSIDEEAIRYPEEETYIRVVSDSQIEIYYRENDEVVVETYTVEGRDTAVFVN